jgi:hypothetical protein
MALNGAIVPKGPDKLESINTLEPATLPRRGYLSGVPPTTSATLLKSRMSHINIADTMWPP